MKKKERENARRAVQGRVAPDEIVQNNTSAAVMAAVVKLWDRCITPLVVSVAVKLFHSFHLNANGLGKVPDLV